MCKKKNIPPFSPSLLPISPSWLSLLGLEDTNKLSCWAGLQGPRRRWVVGPRACPGQTWGALTTAELWQGHWAASGIPGSYIRPPGSCRSQASGIRHQQIEDAPWSWASVDLTTCGWVNLNWGPNISGLRAGISPNFPCFEFLFISPALGGNSSFGTITKPVRDKYVIQTMRKEQGPSLLGCGGSSICLGTIP